MSDFYVLLIIAVVLVSFATVVAVTRGLVGSKKEKEKYQLIR